MLLLNHQAISGELGDNNTLVSLNLGFNPLGAEGTYALVDALADNSSLVELSLQNTMSGSYSSITLDTVEQRLREVLANRGRLTRVALRYPETTTISTLNIASPRKAPPTDPSPSFNVRALRAP